MLVLESVFRSAFKLGTCLIQFIKQYHRDSSDGLPVVRLIELINNEPMNITNKCNKHFKNGVGVTQGLYNIGKTIINQYIEKT
jgi:hypothetical protein